MGRDFDPDTIAELARKVGQLKESYNTASTDLGDGSPGNAYGSLSNAASAGQKMQGFYSGVNSELGAAAGLVDSAAQALANAAAGMQNDEDETAITLGGDDSAQA